MADEEDGLSFPSIDEGVRKSQDRIRKLKFDAMVAEKQAIEAAERERRRNWELEQALIIDALSSPWVQCASPSRCFSS